MAVVIKTMDSLPDNCSNCPINPKCDECEGLPDYCPITYVQIRIEKAECEKRPEWCPLEVI